MGKSFGMGWNANGEWVHFAHRCPQCNCNTPFPEYAGRHCPKCGTEQPSPTNRDAHIKRVRNICPNPQCRVQNTDFANYCIECGNKLLGRRQLQIRRKVKLSNLDIVTLDNVFEWLSNSQPTKYILVVQPTGGIKALEYLIEKLNLRKPIDVMDALFFKCTFCNLQEARKFVAECLEDDNRGQELHMGIYFNGELIWEGTKK